MFQVDCDDSATMGVFLSQEGRHVAYLSGKWNDAKRKYYVYDQEFYSIL